MKKIKRIAMFFLLFLIITVLSGCLPFGTPAEPAPAGEPVRTEASEDAAGGPSIFVEKGGRYTSKEAVAAYLHLYAELPPNFITKAEARAAGWESAEGNLWEVAEGMSIGGDVFGNRERILPGKDGRIYYECDINYAGGFRGPERIVYSNDGFIFYTADHYETFIKLYEGAEE